eukprot:TRINITY_DN749_c0_g1_i2.p1 TRINITY_DN749_c0_g1~~TRINITY_DN749_c0_g1_i2.p1  ORF type:complete len:226 (+),score=62.19 TRINITY_DN749_c0_g1_i2:51-728(+)
MDKKEGNLRVLVLHGYFQSGSMMEAKTGSFRKIIKTIAKNAEFVFINAPHRIDPETDYVHPGEPIEEDVYKWWKTDSNWLITKEYVGVEQSIKHIQQIFREKGPFDGVLGFSQGGVLTSILVGLNQDTPTEENPISFKFAVIGSANPPTVPEYRENIVRKSTENSLVPTLHIYGMNDTLVLPQYSEDHLKLYPNAQVLVHEGGHYLPVNSTAKPILREFFQKFVH